jgi:hypothetical protein
MKRPPDLLGAATRLVEIIGPDHCLVVGALAVAAHGYVRATIDVDVICRLSLADVVTRLRNAGIEAELKRGDILEGDFSCVKGTLDGVPFDVLPPLVMLRWEQAETLTLEGGELRVVDLEALFRLKMRAGGPKDLIDAAMLALIHPRERERALAAAAAYRLEDRFLRLLEDPRLQADARELQAGPPRRRRPKRPGRKQRR